MHASKYIVKRNNYTKKICTDEHTYKYVKSVDFIQLATTGEITPGICMEINDYAISLTNSKLYKIYFRFILKFLLNKSK